MGQRVFNIAQFDFFIEEDDITPKNCKKKLAKTKLYILYFM